MAAASPVFVCLDRVSREGSGDHVRFLPSFYIYAKTLEKVCKNSGNLPEFMYNIAVFG